MLTSPQRIRQLAFCAVFCVAWFNVAVGRSLEALNAPTKTGLALYNERLPFPVLRTLAQGLMISATTSPAGQAPAPVQRVLVLYSDERLLPANIIVDEAIRATFTVGTSNRIEFHSEFLDVSRFPGEAQQQRQRDFLRDKYRERAPDLVIAGGGAALDFLLKYRAALFADIPIVHCAVDAEALPKEMPDAKIVGIPMLRSAASTLELALRLQPDTRNVAVVAGSTPADLESAEQFRRETPAFGNRVVFTWLTNLSMEELRGELSRLPDHTVVLYLTMFQDAAGKTFTPRQALDAFAPASRAPVYGCYDTYLGHGIVGGSIVMFEEIGRKAAQLGIRILAGEDAQAAARSESQQAVPMFDWHQLRRWNISEHQLPPGSIIRFKETTYWEKHYGIIITALSLCLLEALLIVALLAQLRRRRLAEEALRESEQRMSLGVSASNFGIWIRDFARNEIWASDKWRELLGFTSSQRLELECILQRLHPDDREAIRQALAKAVAGGGRYEMEYRVMLPDGRMRWIASQGCVEFDAKGQPVLMRGASRDCTAQKQAEQETLLLRQEIAHVGRVSMMGQLASALAHEINQPLGAILRNAEAGELFLENESPDLDEIRAILVDIRKDDQRAGNVIDRMRALLKRRDLETRSLDVSELVGEVASLARADAAARQVELDVEVAGGLPLVRGDRVHLQQVLLNLILNGMDALNEVSRENRRVSVTARLDGMQTVEIAVSDTGHGIPADKLAHVFDPFFTTKPNGLGMGLSISRTIIEAHGGRLWAENNNADGAAFRFTLSIAEEAAAG
jgi:PAS domain S-box-containing protein